MAGTTLIAKKPELLKRKVKIESKTLISKSIATLISVLDLKFGSAFKSSVEALFSITLDKMKSEEVIWLLIQRSLIRATFSLLEDNGFLTEKQKSEKAVRGLAKLEISFEKDEIELGEAFFEFPNSLAYLNEFKNHISQWLEPFGKSVKNREEILNSIDEYFLRAMGDEIREHAEQYASYQGISVRLEQSTKCGIAWEKYNKWLADQVTTEKMMGEDFGLADIYVDLRAYYKKENQKQSKKAPKKDNNPRELENNVVMLHEDLESWMLDQDQEDTLRVITGGPGSGKSSLCKMFAYRMSQKYKQVRFVYIPLHNFNCAGDLHTTFGEYLRLHKPCPIEQHPLEKLKENDHIFIIFDGLDELSEAGKGSAELAGRFVQQLETQLGRWNAGHFNVQVILSGREIAIQGQQHFYQKPHQLLLLLPYKIKNDEIVEFKGDTDLIKKDYRDDWWKNFGKVIGKNYKDCPKELKHEKFEDITTQPLLNYLVAYAYSKGELEITKEIEINNIYSDLLKSVYKSDYKESKNIILKGVDIEYEEFEVMLEEIGLASWYGGDGRKTTIGRIEDICKRSDLVDVLDKFRMGSESGAARLLLAFFFRKGDSVAGGEATFEFTHKSFSEYLTAKRILRTVEDIDTERKKKRRISARKYSVRGSLVEWLGLCGPAMMDTYIHEYLCNEMKILGEEDMELVESFQETFTELFNAMLEEGGLPIEELGTLKPKIHLEAQKWVCRAETGLLGVVNACARTTKQLVEIKWPNRNSMKKWLQKLSCLNEEDDSLVVHKYFSYCHMGDRILISRCDLFSLAIF